MGVTTRTRAIGGHGPPAFTLPIGRIRSVTFAAIVSLPRGVTREICSTCGDAAAPLVATVATPPDALGGGLARHSVVATTGEPPSFEPTSKCASEK